MSNQKVAVRGAELNSNSKKKEKVRFLLSESFLRLIVDT